MPAASLAATMSGSPQPLSAKEKRAAMTPSQLRRHIDVRIAQYVPLFEVEPGLVPMDRVVKLLRAVNESPAENVLQDALYFLAHVQVVDPRTGVTHTCYRLPQLRAALLKACVPESAPAMDGQDSEETILRAFQAIDREGKGYVEAAYLKQVMTEMGEAFSEDEMSEMIEAAQDADTGLIYYEDFAALLATE